MNFIVRSPIESIQKSIALSNRFYLMVALGVCVIGAAFIAFLAKRLTKPLTELTEISIRMANLDFDVKYTSGGEDEIGVLGHNFNQMSETLEQTISELKTANNELQKDIEKKEKIDELVFDNYLDTAGIPDPDLMIRTSGELRLSNFLLWQMAYTEFYFTDVAWPDFNKAELIKAIEKYNQRDRR